MYRFLGRENLLSAWWFSTIALGGTTLAGGSGPFCAPQFGGSLSGRLVGRPLVGWTLCGGPLFGGTLPGGLR
jgi:hypothetical protein